MNGIHIVFAVTIREDCEMEKSLGVKKSTRAKGRPNKPLVTRENIASSALKIIHERGYSGLTMSALARSLGVAPSALYNHISNKDDLLTLVQDAVMRQVNTDVLDQALAGELSPVDALTAWATSYRTVFADHLPLIAVIATTRIAGAANTIAMYEKVAEVLSHAGLADDEILPRIVSMESFIYGSAYDVHAPNDIFDVHGDPLPDADSSNSTKSSDNAGEDSPPAPHLERAYAALGETFSGGPGVNQHADGPFRLGISALLHGLDRLTDAPSASRQH